MAISREERESIKTSQQEKTSGDFECDSQIESFEDVL